MRRGLAKSDAPRCAPMQTTGEMRSSDLLTPAKLGAVRFPRNC